mmetsp:Transcript_32964/g.104983  ORF Transcript_32964/g.104983 Transcript_32964/m.104983 type:complete len:196 (-) Transcript_32964:380-967(-)
MGLGPRVDDARCGQPLQGGIGEGGKVESLIHFTSTSQGESPAMNACMALGSIAPTGRLGARTCRGAAAPQRGAARAPGRPGRMGNPAARRAGLRRAGGIDPVNVEELAKMAQLEVTPEEVEEWTPKIESIVSWFGQLAEIDVEGVEPSLRAGEDENCFREDTPVVYGEREGLMKEAPLMEGGSVKIPKIMGESAD